MNILLKHQSSEMEAEESWQTTKLFWVPLKSQAIRTEWKDLLRHEKLFTLIFNFYALRMAQRETCEIKINSLQTKLRSRNKMFFMTEF
jgi:hypothetical protein